MSVSNYKLVVLLPNNLRRIPQRVANAQFSARGADVMTTQPRCQLLKMCRGFSASKLFLFFVCVGREVN
jgi:hypothetical protein